MEKLAVLINGFSSPINDKNFLVVWLREKGYQVKTIEPVLGDKINKVTQKPTVIFGWSMGGLMMPKLALSCPRTKLVFMATAPKVNPGGTLAKVLFQVVKNEWGLKLLNTGLKLPRKVLVDGYELVNKIPDPTVKENYRQQMMENVGLFKSLSEEQIKEAVEFLRSIDNTENLRGIKNPALVFCGKRDKLMPVSEGEKISRLLANGRLVITEGGHYNVISERELPIIENFLE